jgi:hypothetical protein
MSTATYFLDLKFFFFDKFVVHKSILKVGGEGGYPKKSKNQGRYDEKHNFFD